METGMKLLIGAGVGFLVYELYQHFEASGQIVALAASTTPVPAYPVSAATAPVPILSPGAAANVASNIAAPLTPTSTPNSTQLQDLLNWAAGTKNPTLYAEMVNQLTATQLNSLYQILVQQWDTGDPPTVANTAFWNSLRLIYPFLNTGGVGCTNFSCK